MVSTVNDQTGPQTRWRHDMKNQLGVILGFSDLLLEEMDPADPRRGDVQEIHTAATRAMELLAKLLLSEEGPTP
jgi:signal transduction histidine kinase